MREARIQSVTIAYSGKKGSITAETMGKTHYRSHPTVWVAVSKF